MSSTATATATGKRKGSAGDMPAATVAAENADGIAIWTALQVNLGSLHEVQTRIEADLVVLNALEAEWNALPLPAAPVANASANDAASDDTEPEQQQQPTTGQETDEKREELREKLKLAYEAMQALTQEEKSLATESLGQVSVLETLALAAATELSSQPKVKAEPADLSADALSNSTTSAGNKRKKRRLDGSAGTPTELVLASSGPGSRRGSPAPASGGMSRTGSRDAGTGAPLSSTSASQPASARGSAPPTTVKTMSKKDKKAWLEAQLPLQEGRPVAFKPPPKKGAKAEAGMTDFIQGNVVGIVAGSKDKYVVQDIDDASSTEDIQKPGASYNVKLKDILPLPDQRNRSTYPPVPYAAGMDVYALYPGTSCFYRARVSSAPGNKNGKYKLIFEEDDGNITTVPVETVVEPPA